MVGLLKAVAGGEITPAEAVEVGKLVDSYIRAAETADLAERIRRLEKMQEAVAA